MKKNELKIERKKTLNRLIQFAKIMKPFVEDASTTFGKIEKRDSYTTDKNTQSWSFCSFELGIIRTFGGRVNFTLSESFTNGEGETTDRKMLVNGKGISYLTNKL